MQGGANAFHLCAQGGHLDAAQCLAPKMEKHLFDTDDNGSTALHKAAKSGQLPMVEYLEKSFAFDVTTKDKVGILRQ